MSKTSFPEILWSPTEEFIRNSNLYKFQKWLETNEHLSFDNYHALWLWSVANPAKFWELICRYFAVNFSVPYEEVLAEEKMPFAPWFIGSTLNYAEHIFKHYSDERPAIIFASEKLEAVEIPWAEMKSQVASLSYYFRELGIKPGDRIAAFLPNIPEATYAFLAAASIGAVWSSCSPDFGVNSVVDRFQQIEPKLLIAVDGYHYSGKAFDKKEAVKALAENITSIESVLLVPYLNPETKAEEINPITVLWNNAFRLSKDLKFQEVPFNHPLYILYSSGTTGIPKALTHSHGGNLLEHLKYLHLHNDVHPGERFFWFSTTGWMMWNFVHASLLAGSVIVLYDGNPGYPDLNRLWKLAEVTDIAHFGTSAPYLIACMKAGIKPKESFDLKSLRSIGSTGSPLPPEAFTYVYESIKKDVWLCSMAGGTDVCTAWVGGCPTLPVFKGEIQARSLGAALYAWNEMGKEVINEVGEMVVTKPMPSMPVFFWNDADGKKYLSSYFETYPGVWRHGDWVKITDRQSVVILGRSDATLNRQGVRIGTAEVYRTLDKIDELKDSLIVSLEFDDGTDYMPLFVQLPEGKLLNEDLKQKIKTALRTQNSPRHVPDEILQVPDIPYTISGKKMETPVKKILMSKDLSKFTNIDSMKNPDSLEFFATYYEKLKKRFE
jgi:acetoacetyl-CoA synthetase